MEHPVQGYAKTPEHTNSNHLPRALHEEWMDGGIVGELEREGGGRRW